MTPTDTPDARVRMAGLACCVMAGVLITFAIAGKWIFKFLGITMPAFQLAASIVLLLVALDMLRAQRSRVQETHEETAAGITKATCYRVCCSLDIRRKHYRSVKLCKYK